MIDRPRYAVYFVPSADDALYRFGAGVLGYDCYSGANLPFPSNANLPADWAAITEAPRRYGFHATLLAPIRLAPGREEAALLEACADFADVARDVPTIQPVVRALGKFIAFVPQERNAALDRLAADCVTHFDPFRAPRSADDEARRLSAGLSARQEANLRRWGYPYVFDDFRFHMTLTGSLEEEQQRLFVGDLLSRLAGRCDGDGPRRIDRIVLLRQADSRSRFRVLREFPLRDVATVPSPIKGAPCQ